MLNLSVRTSNSQKAYIANHYIQACITGAQRQGFAAETLLAAAGIPLDWLNQPDKAITEQQLSQLIQAVWRCTRDEFMGLTSRRCKNGVFALMAEFVQQGKTFGGMLQQSARFYSAVYEGIELGLEPALSHANTSHIFYRLHLQDDALDPDHLLQEFLLLMWQRFGSWLVGQQIPFATTCFSYARPAHAAEYRAMYSGQLCYQQPCCGFALHPRYLQLPIVRSESDVQAFLKASPALILHRPDQDDSLQTRVRLLLQQYDFEQMPDLEQISVELHLTPRTLRRKLNEEGGSLRQIKESLRRDFAIKLLTAEHISISEISEKTGFSETAAFCRAFKRWTGKSPSNWRIY
ncbi:AraC-type DNA-binding protein [Oceanospirillum multiglobuliferum]|uniref:AraC family transcriptional regulator n=1 Tax=Oceanospirillum multiglobuliferum TaxID=64969 RepID=A0A1T4KIL6_9GAMM|nr:AraC family transcriptional regulator [Oceanospirillum multiglobuliferum]OPX56041.1 AraC family transcriptional regulator [Oceanospirillum multiglobuliferum]SJZ42259.1 AraC-type DNA-binding protein [Oceanospirillum multiglobuliferum]